MSRNPFRKARDNQEDIAPSSESIAADLFNVKDQEAKPKSTKKKKHVVIKTPPRSPEEPTRRLSLGRPASPDSRQDGIFDPDEDAQDGADSRLEEAFANARTNSATKPSPSTTSEAVRAPYNPFARTLASSDERYGVRAEQQETSQAGERTKPAFDVDMFKDILLNGATPPRAVQEDVGDGRYDAAASSSNERDARNATPSSSTHRDARDATSSSGTQRDARDATPPRGTRKDARATHSDPSDFEGRFPSLEETRSQPSEAPVIMEDDSTDDERRSKTGTGPQTVPFDSFQGIPPSSFVALVWSQPARPSLANKDKQLPGPAFELPGPPLDQQDTDSIKALLPPPLDQRDNDSIKALAPPPPVSRRQGQSSSSNGRRRSSSVMSKSSVQSDTSSIAQPTPGENSTRAPPPPPTRRALGLDKQNMTPPPAPAPRRAPSKVTRTEKRSPSTASRSSLQPLTELASSNTIPPRPPPRRSAESSRSSLDGVRASVGRDSRRVSKELGTAGESHPNMLSDLTALQKEVDELFAESSAG